MSTKEQHMAQTLLEEAREGLEIAIPLLKSIGHYDAVLQIALALITSEIQALEEPE